MKIIDLLLNFALYRCETKKDHFVNLYSERSGIKLFPSNKKR